MFSIQCFRLVHFKLFLTRKNVITEKLFKRGHIWRSVVEFCPFKGGYFNYVYLGIDVPVRLGELSAYGRLKM